jgi:drug/metabolite transporter (DMT)-like permease
LRFGAVSGLVAYVIPNAMLFLAIPHLGSGLAGLMFALSAVVTAAISILFRVRPPSRGLLIAVLLGFLGAVFIVLGRDSLPAPSAKTWVLLALAIPISLAVGNVFRTAAWPSSATPTQAGAASNLSAAPFLLIAAWVTGDNSFAPLLAHWPLALTQWICSLLMFIVFFRLQLVGGPTYLSQIGYIAAAVGLAIGTLWFGETYPLLVWVGAGLIIAGIAANIVERSLKPSA